MQIAILCVEKILEKHSEIFKSLADPTRLRLAVMLARAGECCVCHLAAALDEPDYKASRHLGVMRSSGLVKTRREGTWMHYRLSETEDPLVTKLAELLRSLAGTDPVYTEDMRRLEETTCVAIPQNGRETAPLPKVLFLCTGNSCRSQMAEGWARNIRGGDFEAYSAGVERHGLNPLAVKTMAEAGVNISMHTSKTIDELEDVRFDLVVTVCDNARERCPLIPAGARTVHHGFDDPPRLALGAASEEEALEHYRVVRDRIRDFVRTLQVGQNMDGEQGSLQSLKPQGADNG